MPSAEKWLFDKWAGEGCDESKALNFLTEKGWKQVKNGLMIPPQEEISRDEYEAMLFLVQEWDFACGKKVKVR